jgi:hypothetical protein
VHLWYDSVVIDGRSLLEKRGTVDVKRRLGEGEFGVPVVTSRLTGDKVDGLDGVVEIGEIDLGIRAGRELVLGLSEEKVMLVISEELTLLSVEVDVVTPDLRSTSGGVPRPCT